MDQKIVPNLWFDTEAEEAAEFYCSVFEDSRIVAKTHYGEGAPREAGMVMTVAFELHGQRFVGINGGPEFKFDEVRGSFVGRFACRGGVPCGPWPASRAADGPSSSAPSP
jgi:predicted 3-demethylubiquinone-9 3-methyltransferase (glyoxalase superfamily)